MYGYAATCPRARPATFDRGEARAAGLRSRGTGFSVRRPRSRSSTAYQVSDGGQLHADGGTRHVPSEPSSNGNPVRQTPRPLVPQHHSTVWFVSTACLSAQATSRARISTYLLAATATLSGTRRTPHGYARLPRLFFVYLWCPATYCVTQV